MSDFRIGLVLVCEDCGFDVELPDDLAGTVTCTVCGVAAWVDLPYAEPAEALSA